MCAVAVLFNTVQSAFTAVTGGPPSTFAAGTLDGYLPTSVTATRTDVTTCLVSWTPRSSVPAGLTYDVTDGSGATIATAQSGTSASVTVPASTVTPTVLVRYGSWVSTNGVSAAAPCNGYPAAPTGVSVTPSEAALAVSWTAPAGNGGTIASYAVAAVPSDTSLPNATCSVTAPGTACSVQGLVNGVSYAVTVTATSDVGTGPASAAVSAVPYPSSLMSGSHLRLWLDGADASTLFAGSGCSGGTATASVGCWKDKSDQHDNVTQATSGYRPGLTTVRGRSVPLFDGIDDYLAGDVTKVPTGTATSTVAVAGAVDPSIAMNGVSIISWGGTTSGTQRRLTSWSATGVDAYSTPQAFTTAWPDAQAQGVAVGEFASGTSMSVWANGSTGSTASGAYTTGTDHLWLGTGGDAAPSGEWKGPVSEVIVFDRTLTTAERRVIEEYLARKWGSALAPGPPTALAATVDDSQSTVTWAPPSWDGGSAITSYTLSASSPGQPTITLSCVSPCSFNASLGLVNGAAYTIAVSATSASGTGPAATTTVTPQPAVLTAGNLALWLDAQNAASLSAATDCSGSGATTGQGIGCWKDRSSSGFNLARGASSGTALLTAAAIGGHPAIRFVRTDPDYFESTQSGTGALASADRTVLAVATARTTTDTSGPANGGGIIAWPYDTTGLYASGSGTSTTVDRAFAGGRNSAEAGMFPVQQATPPWVMAATMSTSGSTLTTALALQGRGTATSVTAATPWLSYPNLLRVGSFGTSATADYAFPLDGDLGEIMVFNRALTAVERRSVEEYLARKWGVKIAPSAPSWLTVTPGDSQASVAWRPSWNGGSSITGYTVTATPSDSSLPTLTPSCISSPCAVTGMVNGADYTFAVTATNAVGTGPAATTVAWSYPTSLFASSALKVWLDAQYAPALSAATDCSDSAAPTGTVVGCWKDRSGNAWDAAAPSGATGATLTAGAINGYSALRFGFAQPHLYRATATGLGALAAADRSVFAVAASRNTYGIGAVNCSGTIAAFSAGYGTGILAKSCGGSTTTVTRYQSDAYDSAVNGLYPGLTATVAPAVISAVYSSSAGTLSDALALNGTGASTTASLTGSWKSGYGDVFSIGSSAIDITSDYAYPLDGDLGEVLVFNRAVTSVERRTVEEYLARHWGIAIAPSAPTLTALTQAAPKQLTATWSAPSWNGGSAVTSYTATASASGYASKTCTGTGTSCTITQLTSGVTYTVTVTATNAIGAGPAGASLSRAA